MITNSFTVLLRNDLLTILHALVLIGRWCFEHSLSDCVIVCEFYYYQRVLKTFPDTGYLPSEDGLVVTMTFTGIKLFIAVVL